MDEQRPEKKFEAEINFYIKYFKKKKKNKEKPLKQRKL